MLWFSCHARPLHFYSSAAEMYRAFAEAGAVWQAVGKASGRADVSAHGARLLGLAPLLYRDLHASMSRTNATGDWRVTSAPCTKHRPHSDHTSRTVGRTHCEPALPAV